MYSGISLDLCESVECPVTVECDVEYDEGNLYISNVQVYGGKGGDDCDLFHEPDWEWTDEQRAELEAAAWEHLVEERQRAMDAHTDARFERLTI